LTGIGVSLLALGGIILWLSYFHSVEEGEFPAVWRNALGRLVVVALTLYFVRAISKRPASGRRELSGLSLLFLLWLDACTHMPWQNPTVPPDVYQADLQPARKLDPLPKAGETRAMVSLVAIQKFNLTVLGDPVAACLGTRMGLSHNCNLLENIPKVDGFYSLYLREEREVRRRLYLTTNSILERMADYLGVSQITAKGTFFDWTPRTTFLPLITAGQKPVFADNTATLTALMDSDFDPERILYLPLETKPFAAGAAQTRAVAYNRKFSSHEVRFSVNAQLPAVVSVAQSCYHWWNAYVDGRSVPLLRANYAFQAVVVPAGTHEVKLVYNDLSFLIGTIISVISLAALAAASLAIRPL